MQLMKIIDTFLVLTDVDAKIDADEDTFRCKCRIKRPTPPSAFPRHSSFTRTRQGWRRDDPVASPFLHRLSTDLPVLAEDVFVFGLRTLHVVSGP